nr:immunoglobulin heavy chain junction region [Macaca mulatta]MOX59120.1 immunoglobulin heavy chain junction region [Macaca mulatta]MOX59160.1 immunoglobulin heavy chain junction region [Macaca mulatta]MOX59407.1 immunoglobulin heavy chain junction region [Macaca mulatta]MOX61300.1 immunoglobulin heavy chain junction region [Macaca mulatta]
CAAGLGGYLVLTEYLEFW